MSHNGKRLSITPATADDANAITALLTESTYHLNLIDYIDWMDVGDYWLKATRDGVVVGCVQVIFARPIARFEYLAVADDLEPYVQAKIIRLLVDFACQTLGDNGAQAVSGTVPFVSRVAKKQLKKLGAVISEQGNIVTKRLN